jgi:DNA-binding transcriptional ArsR family regulator
MNPAYIQQLIAIADAAQAAPHGEKEAIYQRACESLGKSRATLMSHLKRVAVRCPRKRRADAGLVELSREEADVISAYLMEGYRKNSRKITPLKEAVAVLRANDAILAGCIDPESGEIRYLSESAIARGLKTYGLHPDQLRQATPHTRLRSLHPNHVWQVDASVCVVYYLPDGGTGMAELDDAVHYKNKPENLKAIEQFRVIRYVVADHASGLIRYRYYPHAESGEHTVRFLAWAMADKVGNDPFRGAPFIVMVDPGATSGGLVRRFCERMGIELIVNKSSNARAKGSVEKGNHLVETTFEQALRYLAKRPRNFDEINALAEKYQITWNATAVHSRHGKTRFAVWMTIKPDQLRTVPGADVLLSLATEEPIKRQVKGDLTVPFKNRIWDVSHVPGVMVKGEVFVHWHPFMADTAMAVVWGEDGREQHIALPEKKKNDLGFFEDAAVIGQEHKAKPDTLADTNRKRIARLAAQAPTYEEAEKKRGKTEYTPFGGAIDPFAHLPKELPTMLKKRGTDLGVNAPAVELIRMNTVQMAKWLQGRLGEDYQPAMLADLQKRFPAGATEPELEEVLVDIRAGRSAAGRAKLQAV